MSIRHFLTLYSEHSTFLGTRFRPRSQRGSRWEQFPRPLEVAAEPAALPGLLPAPVRGLSACTPHAFCFVCVSVGNVCTKKEENSRDQPLCCRFFFYLNAFLFRFSSVSEGWELRLRVFYVLIFVLFFSIHSSQALQSWRFFQRKVRSKFTILYYV